MVTTLNKALRQTAIHNGRYVPTQRHCLVASVRLMMMRRRERRDVDRLAHRVIAGVVGMEIIPKQLSELAVGYIHRLHVARSRVERSRVKILHSVKQSGGANEVVQDQPVRLHRS